MKGEYVEHNSETPKTNMFSKLHHPHHHHRPLSSPFHLSSPADSATASHKPSPVDPSSSSAAAAAASAGDGSSIEVVRRPRGRPPGSKNKPKPPVFVTRDADPPMSPYILEIPSGNDVVEAINRFCLRRGIGISVLSGSGAVANVTLRQPSPAAPGSTITFHGKFDVLSMSATFLPSPPRTALNPPIPNVFTVSLAGPQGQVVGGFVAGPLIAAGTVYVIAASFNNPSYHRLPVDEEPRNSASAGTGEGEGQSPPLSGGGGESGHVAGSGGESCGVSMYSCQMGGSDVIWAPTARAPPPY